MCAAFVRGDRLASSLIRPGGGADEEDEAAAGKVTVTVIILET